MNAEDFKWAKKVADEYRKIRKYFSMDFYNHGSNAFDATSWAIWQYHNSETQSGIVMAFRRSESPFEQVTIGLKGLSEDETIICTDFNTNNTFESSSLLSINLPQKRSSVIIEYKSKFS